MQHPLRVLVAAGGTGGHLYPALAVVRELESERSDTEAIFVGTRRGLERRLVAEAGYSLELLRVEPLRGGSPLRKLKSLIALFLGVLDARRMLRRLRPHVVLGIGGYVSGPLLAMAALGGFPTLILEPNAVPGLANRWLARWVDDVALAWEETRSHFRGKGFVAGNPVRREIAAVPPELPDTGLRLLVFGGSQGAHALNVAMAEALPHLHGVRARLSVVHQTGMADLESTRAAYRRAGMPAKVETYLDEMAREYAASNLVLCRAGATSCAELAASGRPALLVPLPLAGGHQRHNAEMMERAGAARVIPQGELEGEMLARILVRLIEAPGDLRQMGERARALARPHAAGVIARRLLALAESKRASS